MDIPSLLAQGVFAIALDHEGNTFLHYVAQHGLRETQGWKGKAAQTAKRLFKRETGFYRAKYFDLFKPLYNQVNPIFLAVNGAQDNLLHVAIYCGQQLFLYNLINFLLSTERGRYNLVQLLTTESRFPRVNPWSLLLQLHSELL